MSTKKYKQPKDILFITAPVSGEVVLLENINEPMVSAKAFGEGIAIETINNVMCSPCSGVVKFIHGNNHAVIIEHNSGLQVLVHMGIGNVIQDGSFFSNVREGQKVNTGDKLIEFDLSKFDYKLITIVVVSDFGKLDNNINFINTNQTADANETILYAVGKTEHMQSEEFNAYIKQCNTKEK